MEPEIRNLYQNAEDPALMSLAEAFRYIGAGIPSTVVGSKRLSAYIGTLLLIRGQQEWQYAGSIVDNKANGRGMISYPNNSQYFGQVQDNNRHGRGFIIYATCPNLVWRGTFEFGNKIEGNWYLYDVIVSQEFIELGMRGGSLI